MKCATLRQQTKITNPPSKDKREDGDLWISLMEEKDMNECRYRLLLLGAMAGPCRLPPLTQATVGKILMRHKEDTT